MAGKIIGSIEHFTTTGLVSASAQAAFVAAFNMLRLYGPQVGIQLIAWNQGTARSGEVSSKGWPGYYNQTGTAGENAWACFRFASASYPFDLFMQWTHTATWINALYLNNSSGGSQCGFSMCARVDGGPAWNGSSGSVTDTGGGTMGTPFFRSSSQGGLFFPRSNDAVRAGANGATARNIVGTDSGTNVNSRYHYFADKDSFVALWDESNDGAYEAMYIGPYTPLSGSGLDIQLPLVAIRGALPFVAGTSYGDAAGTSTTQGAVLFPSASVSGTCGITMDRYGTTLFQNTLAQPNRAYPTASYNEFSILIGILDGQSSGPLGYIDTPLFREVYGVGTHDTNGSNTRAAFGNTTLLTVKVTVPWHSGTVPGSGLTQQGVQFTIP